MCRFGTMYLDTIGGALDTAWRFFRLGGSWLCGRVDFLQSTTSAVPTSGARLENVVIPNEVRDLRLVLAVNFANNQSYSGGGSRLPDPMIIGASFFGRCRRNCIVNSPAVR